jgi:hypothetical protein
MRRDVSGTFRAREGEAGYAANFVGGVFSDIDIWL